MESRSFDPPQSDLPSGAASLQTTAPRATQLKRQVVAWFFAAFLAIQIAVPLVQLVWSPRPARFGWQMYSVVSAAPRFELIMRDGATRPLDITPYVTSLRADVPIARFLPPHLCTLFPDATAVSYALDGGARTGTYQCNS
jgi:hypothetical protein